MPKKASEEADQNAPTQDLELLVLCVSHVLLRSSKAAYIMRTSMSYEDTEGGAPAVLQGPPSDKHNATAPRASRRYSMFKVCMLLPFLIPFPLLLSTQPSQHGFQSLVILKIIDGSH